VERTAASAASKINGQWDESCREALVAMVQPANLWNRDDSSVPRRLDRSRARTVFVQ
jgi:hypothetical protein